jgi:hypothetical protein
MWCSAPAQPLESKFPTTVHQPLDVAMLEPFENPLLQHSALSVMKFSVITPLTSRIAGFFVGIVVQLYASI